MKQPTHLAKGRKRLCVLERSSNFHKNLSKYEDGKNPWLNQVHHILPCTLFKYANIKKTVGNNTAQASFIWDCLWITKWDINRRQNLIMLPLKGTYWYVYRKLGIPSVPAKLSPLSIKAIRQIVKTVSPQPRNLPAHDYNHNNAIGYNSEVKAYIKANIWNALQVVKGQHNVKPKSILTHLKNAETTWRRRLKTRATSRQGGTVVAWVNRKHLTHWYEPFCMAIKATKISKPR